MNNTQKTIEIINEFTEIVVTVNEMLPDNQFLCTDFAGHVQVLAVHHFGYDADLNACMIKPFYIKLPDNCLYGDESIAIQAECLRYIEDLRLSLSLEVI